MNWFSHMTEGPWWVDLAAVAATVTAVGIIIRMVLLPGARTIWRAIIAAPQLAAGVGRLVEILETDLLRRVEKLEADSATHTDSLGKILMDIREIVLQLEKTKEQV